MLRNVALCVLLAIGSRLSAQTETANVVHDAEFVRMEQEFGQQWKMIQEHLLLIKKYPHRTPAQSYYRDFDRSFDPEPSPVYKPKKRVDW